MRHFGRTQTALSACLSRLVTNLNVKLYGRNLDTEIAIELFGPIYYRVLISGEPLTTSFIDRLVRAIMAYGR